MSNLIKTTIREIKDDFKLIEGKKAEMTRKQDAEIKLRIMKEVRSIKDRLETSVRLL